MDSPLALYRRYRPETFAEVIGQEHVTEPLRAALAGNRVNHAYLFSGPRGCGKTTSARILARALNCEQAPVADPCGECDSCRDLARNGSGSIDVIEIDAASHGGVDDARELREKAFFAPVRSRYKVYIIDEAHMVTTQGFNALLKLVEEPPPHLRFIFATTEPDKVIPTIRSRTHHYPFRLIPPRLLSSYLSELCELEGVTIEPTALPLVVRAGAGSARDTLSVLDQLLGGAGPAGVTYDLASGLLGYTPDSLLDGVVDAFAAGDGASVFGVVDKVIETGQDPRRFTEDLLRRLRDLVIVSAVPDAPATGLIDVSGDQAERLVTQSARFGRAELTRAADLVAAGLTEMRGATAPRLLLELICARVLLPAADHGTDGVLARLDRLERRMAIVGTPATPEAPPPADAPQRAAAPAPAAEAPAPAPTVEAPAPAAEAPAPVPTEPEPEPSAPPAAPAAAAAPAPPEPAAAPASPSTPGTMSLGDVRGLWPTVIDACRSLRKATWSLIGQNAQVVDFDGTVLTLGFPSSGLRDQFLGGGHEPVLLEAMTKAIGLQPRIDAIVHQGASAASPATTAAPAPVPEPDPPAEPAPPPPRRPRMADIQAEPADLHDPDSAVDRDDADVDAESGADLLVRELGAQVIEETPHQ
ncbi:DNA polymerase III subunit gamma and tau [Nocardioides sp. HM23]|uniref:DNA polymerase III subunit gamma and tau n=1 Tax=Nocardioides bizhenqiangii TaxID=3095076 RepID=UPI002ACA3DEA|nr:DNA polymerase III subunit gamma and tau [Nocardioides sp. HM23]MDZ5622592.1 DNA polymerase III subunit gamma and tau [Nocardioides sp. HM23]